MVSFGLCVRPRRVENAPAQGVLQLIAHEFGSGKKNGTSDRFGTRTRRARKGEQTTGEAGVTIQLIVRHIKIGNLRFWEKVRRRVMLYTVMCDIHSDKFSNVLHKDCIYTHKLYHPHKDTLLFYKVYLCFAFFFIYSYL